MSHPVDPIEVVRAALGIHPAFVNADAGRRRRRRAQSAPRSAAAAAGTVASALLRHWWSQPWPALLGEMTVLHALFGSGTSAAGRRIRRVASAFWWILMLGLPLASVVFTPLAVGAALWLLRRNLGSILLGFGSRVLGPAASAMAARYRQQQQDSNARTRPRQTEQGRDAAAQPNPIVDTLAAAASAVATKAAAAGERILHGSGSGGSSSAQERLHALTQCPISDTTMRHPVTTCDGFTYDRENIERWFALGNRTSPMTGLVLPTLELTPNRTVEALIAELHAFESN
jgi:hypothetical protein